MTDSIHDQAVLPEKHSMKSDCMKLFRWLQGLRDSSIDLGAQERQHSAEHASASGPSVPASGDLDHAALRGRSQVLLQQMVRQCTPEPCVAFLLPALKERADHM